MGNENLKASCLNLFFQMTAVMRKSYWTGAKKLNAEEK